MASQMLRAKDVAARLGIAKSTLYSYISKGHFPPGISIGFGRAVVWRTSAIERFIAEREAAS